MNNLSGLLLVDKPSGWTSFDVVAKIRGILSREAGYKVKVGHAGTLDPMATGLLVLAIGSATKKIDGLMKQSKIYEAVLCLGATSNTDDAEGEITGQSDVQPSHADIESVLEEFIGEIAQVPPQFSAIKVAGQRAYKAAREGKQVELEPRRVTIVSIHDVHYDYPQLSFVADVSSGTYIRSLARDIGASLGTGAYLQSLRRLTVGEMSVQDAIDMDGVNIERIQTNIKPLA